MGQPAAKMNDKVVAVDTHIIMIPSPSGAVPTPLPHPFNGMITGNLSSSVKVNGQMAATQNSTADNMPPHIPQGGPFQVPPMNRATITMGSATVKINGLPAARNGDMATTCDDLGVQNGGTVIAVGTVMVG